MIAVYSVVIAVVSILYYFYILPPDGLEPNLWKEPCKLNKLEKNTILKNTITFYENSADVFIPAPESFAFDENTGNAFATLADGRVAQFLQNGSYVGIVLFTGGYVLYSNSNKIIDSSYNGISGNEDLMKYCQVEAKAKRLAWNVTAEKLCGRPLGSRIIADRKNAHPILYILDAYHGLFEIDLKSNVVKHHFDSNTEFWNFADGKLGYSNKTRYDPVVALPIKFFNDLDIINESAGKIVIFTDTSYKNSRSENRQELIDGAPRGRVFQYSFSTKKLSVLLCGLHFPNGVQQIPSTNRRKYRYVLVVELSRFRVLKLNYDFLIQSHLAAAGKADTIDQKMLDKSATKWNMLQSCSEHGSLWSYLDHQQHTSSYIPPGGDPNHVVSVFLDSVTGVMDNIRINRYYDDTKNSDESNKIYRESNVNLLIGAGTKSSQPFSFLWLAYQSNYLRYFIGKVVPMQNIEKLVPKYGLVFNVNIKGQILNTYQDPSGEFAHLISEAQRHPITGDLWLGSHSNQFLSILPSKFLSAVYQ